ncbi:MAG: exonuclease SbcCD subunit D [Oscillospiraceae bacterium]|nr:exonuclease SbcCD subunit D [Oscillospiraceae bacterium]
MKFLHLADLHFGKSIHGVSMLENGDQLFWADSLLALAGELRPDAVVIAGDVYDRSTPSGDAVVLLDHLLTGLSSLGLSILMVAGNHDSGQRLSFAGDLLARQNVHIAGFLSDGGEITHVTLRDEYGPVTFWLLPYVFPAAISHALGDEDIRGDYDSAVRRLLEKQALDSTQRNVLVAHQNVTAAGAEALRGGSESMIGGVGQIDFHAFDAFDYVALGHIHAASAVGRSSVRYAGSPLCYHFDETRQPPKGPLLVTLPEKGVPLQAETLHLPPLHPMREIRGAYDEIRLSEADSPSRGEYLRIVLTDRRVTPEISAYFRRFFEGRGSTLMELVSEFHDFDGQTSGASSGAVKEKSIPELFSDFYTDRSGGDEPSEADCELLAYAAECIQQSESLSGSGPSAVDRLLEYLLKQEENA